ncbi:hypothetical protein Zmor_010032 [Zophobas morio]|uniref:Uncharacterized protein n=1 Tax=Zophobas morio TaxID=2755281 RepID=A0AA38MJI1_9CUCU|nr:hypothetical protein Zmor_010032 [Zophobas morio]
MTNPRDVDGPEICGWRGRDSQSGINRGVVAAGLRTAERPAAGLGEQLKSLLQWRPLMAFCLFGRWCEKEEDDQTEQLIEVWPVGTVHVCFVGCIHAGVHISENYKLLICLFPL